MEENSNNNNRKKNFRKRSSSTDEDDEHHDETERRMALEEVKFLQKQRQRRSGIPALAAANSDKDSSVSGSAKHGGASSASKKTAAGAGVDASAELAASEDNKDKDDLVLQDTFAQETAVLLEDPNMVKYVEQELAKKRGRKIDEEDRVENELKRAEDELYKIPEHLKVKKRNSEESSTQWTTGIAEVQLPIEYKLRNIEETEAAKKLLQEKRFMGRTKSEFSGIPSSFSADYFQRGRDYAEKLRREHPELYKDRNSQDGRSGSGSGGGGGAGPKQHDTTNADSGQQRQAATDEFMLERFRKRERARVMRR